MGYLGCWLVRVGVEGPSFFPLWVLCFLFCFVFCRSGAVRQRLTVDFPASAAALLFPCCCCSSQEVCGGILRNAILKHPIASESAVLPVFFFGTDFVLVLILMGLVAVDCFEDGFGSVKVWLWAWTKSTAACCRCGWYIPGTKVFFVVRTKSISRGELRRRRYLRT